MRENFKLAFPYLLKNEGVQFTDDPSDSGGPTKFGITLSAYESFIGCHVMPMAIKNLTLEQAKAFYLLAFWTPLGCEQIHDAAIATAIFDTAVLYGIGTAATLVQRALYLCRHSVKIDGHIGQETIDCLNTVSREEFFKAFLWLILGRIETVIKANPKNERYRKGWVERANRLLTLFPTEPLIKEGQSI